MASKVEYLLLEYDTGSTGIDVGSALKLIDVPWESWMNVVNSFKTKDLLILGAAALVVHQCFYRRQKQRISGKALQGREQTIQFLFALNFVEG